MIQINPADFGEEYQRIVALLTAVLSGDQQTTADIAQEIAGDTGAVLHLAAFAATQIQCLGAECGIDVDKYLQQMGRAAATYNETHPGS